MATIPNEDEPRRDDDQRFGLVPRKVELSIIWVNPNAKFWDFLTRKEKQCPLGVQFYMYF